MRIAVPYDFQTRAIFSLFEDTPYFRIYEVEDGKIGACRTVMTVARGYVAFEDLLKAKGVTDLICGNIEDKAVRFMRLEGIQVHAGIAGDPDTAVNKLLNGTLPEIDLAAILQRASTRREDCQETDCDGDCADCDELE